MKNKATKLLKIRRGVAKSDKTIPIPDTFGYGDSKLRFLGKTALSLCDPFLEEGGTGQLTGG